MSIFRKIFPKSKPKLHLLNREQKLDFAFYILSRYTPIVSQGNEDISLLKDSKDLIKNSILFMYRELLKEPGKKYIEEKYLTFNNENDYKKYLDSLSIMLIALSKFSNNKKLNFKEYIDNDELINSPDFLKSMEASISIEKEQQNEYQYYLSEIESIENDVSNGTFFKKIKFFDFE